MEDDSCRRAGSIPFKWEICPGTPKHTRSASAAAAIPSPSAKVAPRLTPPPSMAAPPKPYYYNHSSSPRISSARSASVSPSRRWTYGGGHRRPPTAFIDATPRETAAVVEYAPALESTTAAPASSFSCFSLHMLRRKGSKKGGSGCRSGSSSSSSLRSFRSDGGLGMRRSVSISSSTSSLPLPPGRRFAETRHAQEVEAATDSGWFF